MDRKNVVFMTCMDGAPDILDYKEWCFKSWDYWCKKNNVELFVLDQEIKDKSIMKPTWQRWWVHEILESNEIEYDQVALVDVDTMVHWDCPNFFEQTDGEFSAVMDKFNIEWTHNSIKRYQDFWPDIKFDWTSYFNCGFIVMSKKHKGLCKDIIDFYLENEDELRKRQHETLKKGSDQTPINYMIRASEHELKYLDERFNLSQLHLRGVLGGLCPMWEVGHVWHFNGFEKTQRNQLMMQVWNQIKENYEFKK